MVFGNMSFRIWIGKMGAITAASREHLVFVRISTYALLNVFRFSSSSEW